MHSLRRAALRSAISASRAVTFKPQTTSFAAQWPRSADAPSVAVRASSRWFSQTARVASDAEDAADKKTVDEAIRSASEVGSVNSVGEPSAEAAESSDAPSSGSSPAAHDISNPVLTDGAARGRDASSETPYGLFIRNMVFEANEGHLKDAFEKYGEVAHAAIARDARGLSKGFGFVWFKDAEAMKKAAAESNGSFWHGRRIQVAPKLKSDTRGDTRGPKRANTPTRSIYVGNIPYETTDAELNKLFRELDNVTDVRIAVDRTTGWPRGFAHADFTDVEAAEKAIQYLEGITLGGRKLRLDFSSATKRQRNQIADTPPELTV